MHAYNLLLRYLRSSALRRRISFWRSRTLASACATFRDTLMSGLRANEANFRVDRLSSWQRAASAMLAMRIVLELPAVRAGSWRAASRAAESEQAEQHNDTAPHCQSHGAQRVFQLVSVGPQTDRQRQRQRQRHRCRQRHRQKQAIAHHLLVSS